ncbi:hypothetical protein EJ02DRAFT_433236 [Clathrospora elynae]|uniref:Uncharacterized protein n=1 Tax=Clathrospora elynae TaxID=706981 RepID=A0A6A5SSF3_9PLEO|nr:hypothetical protein EJ02DRAFT_433236 [Clathrospora elynae]
MVPSDPAAEAEAEAEEERINQPSEQALALLRAFEQNSDHFEDPFYGTDKDMDTHNFNYEGEVIYIITVHGAAHQRELDKGIGEVKGVQESRQETTQQEPGAAYVKYPEDKVEDAEEEPIDPEKEQWNEFSRDLEGEREDSGAESDFDWSESLSRNVDMGCVLHVIGSRISSEI